MNMDAGKRKHEEEKNDVKKLKLEVCPHGVKCYRRNPHHFKEYDHPHLSDFIDKPVDADFPAHFSQDKRVYKEQLEVMRQLAHIKVVKPADTKISDNSKEMEGNVKLEAGSSRSNSTSTKPVSTNNRKMVKTTAFVPNSQAGSVVVKKSCTNMKERLEESQPYNLFFTKVPDAFQTLDQYNSISFPDLLCPSLGVLKDSLQMNFMIDIMWLHEQYQVHGLGDTPMTILYGYEFPNMKEYMDMKLKNVTYHMIKMENAFGIHHSKVGIYAYEDESVRVVISTANLYFEDWNYYNQGLWVSDACPKMEDSQTDYECSGPTGFKIDLINYLKSYNLPVLNKWIQIVKRANFSKIRVCLVTSTPGKHFPNEAGCHLHTVGKLLSKHCELPQKTSPESEGPLAWGIIAQASSIGSLGKNAGEWLRKVLLRSLASHTKVPLPSNSPSTLSVVFPTGHNVMHSLFGAQGGGCLPYSKVTNEKQKWLQDYFHEWKADRSGRSRAMPHIKTYCRVSPCLTKLAWFLLTSANISKSAWGTSINKDSSCYVRSCEVGVLFLPKFFEEEYFTIDGATKGTKLFPFMYDLPLSPYTSSDEPWCN